ncbi:MAG: HNH endonuclease [Patescibacteria group bacterium]|nr:HNH endonuclease [Patescibacteria group bacterium]
MKCKIWPGCKDKDGYGMVKIEGKQYRAHRIALENKLGRKLQNGEWALHKCDNPSCVEESHLYAGTVIENNRKARKKRLTLARTVLGVQYG